MFCDQGLLSREADTLQQGQNLIFTISFRESWSHIPNMFVITYITQTDDVVKEPPGWWLSWTKLGLLTILFLDQFR